MGREIKLSDVDTDPVIIDGILLGDERTCSSVKLLQQLLVELKLHVEATEKDIKVAAQNAPGHGKKARRREHVLRGSLVYL